MKHLALISLALFVLLLPAVAVNSVSASEEQIILGAEENYHKLDSISLTTSDDQYTLTVSIDPDYRAIRDIVIYEKGEYETNKPSWVQWTLTKPLSTSGDFKIIITPTVAYEGTIWWKFVSTSGVTYVIELPLKITGATSIGSDDTYSSSPYYVYTVPDEINLTTNSSLYWVFIQDATVLTYAENVSKGNGTLHTNLPNWIIPEFNDYTSSGGSKSVHIGIYPSAEVDKQYFIEYIVDNKSVVVLLDVKVSYETPTYGGDTPTQGTNINNSDTGNKIYIYEKTVWDYLSEVLSSSSFLLIICVSIFLMSFSVRRRHT